MGYRKRERIGEKNLSGGTRHTYVTYNVLLFECLLDSRQFDLENAESKQLNESHLAMRCKAINYRTV